MIGDIATVLFGFILGGLAGGWLTYVMMKPRPYCPSQKPYIQVESTSDPSTYRAVYEVRGRIKHIVTGTGVTGAMEQMIEKIER